MKQELRYTDRGQDASSRTQEPSIRRVLQNVQNVALAGVLALSLYNIDDARADGVSTNVGGGNQSTPDISQQAPKGAVSQRIENSEKFSNESLYPFLNIGERATKEQLLNFYNDFAKVRYIPKEGNNNSFLLPSYSSYLEKKNLEMFLDMATNGVTVTGDDLEQISSIIHTLSEGSVKIVWGASIVNTGYKDPKGVTGVVQDILPDMTPPENVEGKTQGVSPETIPTRKITFNFAKAGDNKDTATINIHPGDVAQAFLSDLLKPQGEALDLFVEANAKATGLQNSLTAQKKENKKLMEANAQLEKRVEELDTKNQEQGTRILDLTGALSASQAKLSQSVQENADKTRTITGQEKQIRDLNESIATMKKDFPIQTNKAVNKKVEEEQAKAEAVIEEINATATAEKENLEAQLNTATAEKENLEAQLNTATAEKENLQAELNTATSEKENLEAQLNTATAEKENLQAELNTATAEKENLQAELNTATAEKTNLEAQLNGANDDIKRLQAQVEERDSHIGDYEEELARLKQAAEENEKLEADLAKAKKVAEEARSAAVSSITD